MAGRQARCFGCQQPEFSLSENLLDLQCGHMYCELCLTTVQKYSSSSVCPACGDLSSVSEKQLLYPVNQWLDDQQTRWSHRQPFHGRNASCPMPNTGHPKAGNSQKHLLSFDETDFPRSYQKIMHGCKSFQQLNSPKKLKRNAKNDELEGFPETIKEPVSDAQNLKGAHEPFSISPVEEEMLLVVEDALSMGSSNFDKLNDVLQTLDQLQVRKKAEEKKIDQFMNEEFSKISVALHKRKGRLHQELAADADRLYTEIEDAKKMIKKRLDYLKGAMQLAKGLKETPSSRTYCDLNQIVGCLKSPVKSDCSVVHNIKARTSFSRLVVNIEEIICALQKIDFESKRCPHPRANEDVGKAIQVPSFQDETSSGDTSLSLDATGSSLKHLDNKSTHQEYSAVHSKGNEYKLNDASLTLLKKGVNTLPSTSFPDVIIEEVIDDDEESCLSEHFTETPKEVKIAVKCTQSAIQEEKASEQELVFVTHVSNPCNFYIQRYSEKKTANGLEEKIAAYCSTTSSPNPNDVLVLGESMFVRSKEHNKWCRATITELIPLESKNAGKPCGPTKYEINEISVMKVFLQDFGSIEVLLILGFGCLYSMTLEHLNLHHSIVKDLCPYLRKIDPKMEDKMNLVDALAVQCALKDIVPRDSMCGWGEEAKEEFLRMVSNKAVLMIVFKEEHGKLIVDLKKPGTNKITSDMPVSLRDALVFTELARFRSNDSNPLSQGQSVSRYAPASLPKLMASVPAVVCYVNSPTDFYIQMMDTLDYMYIGRKIQEVYANDDGDGLEILCPVRGQPCIAMFENEWYRAEVISLPGNREVEVKYVDFGNIAKVNVKQLRKIKDEFLGVPQKAICCQLAYIEPLIKNAEWSEDAVERFQSLVCDKILPCSVVGTLQDGKLSVQLYESVQLYDSKPLPGKQTSSINSSLVEDNLALFISGESSFKKVQEVWDPEPEIMFSESDYDSACFEENFDFSSLKTKEELPVRICHVESPDKIFVRWLSSERQLKRFQNELYDAYQTSKPEKIEWCVDMNCAVEQPILKQWYRGKVKQVVSEKYVQIFYFDYGNHELVNVSRLRTIHEDTRTLVPLALAISLKDIRPAGGSEKWTATACDCLSLYLKGTVASVILEENCSKQPFSVKLLKNEGGQQVDVSNFLVSNGLAFKEKRSQLAPEIFDGHTDIIIQKDALETSSVVAESNCPSKPEELSVLDRPSLVEKPLVLSKGSTVPYKPPCILSEKRFQAEVSSIGDDGTVYVVQKSLKNELEKLMEHMQNDLKCLGILEPYGWKKGEGCSVRGSDTMWYRGKVMDVVGGSIRVYYVDYGYIEKIPECHLCPSVLYPEVPQFAIPCELNKILPIGGSWQPDAVELIKEFLMKRLVDVHPVVHSEDPDGRILVSLYCEGISLSHFMEHHKHCFTEDNENRISVDTIHVSEEDLLNHWSNRYQDLLLPEYETPLLTRYALPVLPYPGKQFPVIARHVETPNEMFVCLEPKESMNHLSDTDDSGLSCESEMDAFELELRRCSQRIETLPPLKDFRSEMPCLAMYTDGQLYRAKFLSVQQYDPVSIMVQYVDYGSPVVLPTGSLFEIPATLMQYPVRAIKVKLAGFKPPLDDGETERIPYRPDWSMAALFEMMDSLNKKELLASTVARYPEPIVFLYKEDGIPVHMTLVDKGLADLDD